MSRVPLIPLACGPVLGTAAGAPWVARGTARGRLSCPHPAASGRGPVLVPPARAGRTAVSVPPPPRDRIPTSDRARVLLRARQSQGIWRPTVKLRECCWLPSCVGVRQRPGYLPGHYSVPPFGLLAACPKMAAPLHGQTTTSR